jgi:DNA-binding MarR family transcriptional regulator
MRTDADSLAFCELFPALYLALCWRHGEGAPARLTPQQDGVLQHLALSGPLSIGEMSRHFARAQSVVSELVDALEARSLLERLRDERDRRRVLVWLTAEGEAVLRQRRQVLDPVRVGQALRALPAARRRALLQGLQALVRAAQSHATPGATPKKGRTR